MTKSAIHLGARRLSLGLTLGLSLIAQSPSDLPATIAQFGNGASIQALATDANGNIYVAGVLSGTLARALSCPGYFGGFVAKVTPEGKTLWNTPLCTGSLGVEAAALALDGSGNVYVAGSTPSRDFPVTLPRTGVPGKSEGYWGPSTYGYPTKLGRDGALVYSALFGGEASDTVTGLAVTGKGLVAVTGYTASQSFSVTSGAAFTRPGFTDDNGFAIQFAGTGALAYATYLPGFSVATSGSASRRPAVSIAWEASGTALVVGSSAGRISREGSSLSDPFPSLPGFVLLSKIVIDAAGNVYVAGAYAGPDSASAACSTYGYSYPAWETVNPAWDIGVVKLARDTLAPLYSEHLGGVCKSDVLSLDVTPDGIVTVAGSTLRGGFPMIDPVSQTVGAVAFRLNQAGRPILSSYIQSAVPAASALDGAIYI